MRQIVYRCKEDYSYTSTVDESTLDNYEWVHPESDQSFQGASGVMMELVYRVDLAQGIRVLMAIPHDSFDQQEVMVAIPYDRIITVEFKGDWDLS